MIYLDHHATTPLDPRVLEAMLPYLKEHFGNSASRTHKFGWDAEEAVENAREQLALLINCSPHNIIFTSGATESNNMILKQGKFQSVVIGSIEHSSIATTAYYLKDQKRFEALFPNQHGVVYVERLLDLEKPDLISLMLVNNEIGTVQNVHKIGNSLKQDGTLLHSDMAQALGKISVDVEKLNVDFASFSAHKIYGPKGVGALYVRDIDSLEPFIHGGQHEMGLRAGTLNVPAIVGFGKACEIIRNEFDEICAVAKETRQTLKDCLSELIPGMQYHNFHPQVPGSLHVALPCDDIVTMLGVLGDKVAVSTSSACTSMNTKSRVLHGLMPEEEMTHSVRMCTGRFNTVDEMKEAAQHIADAVALVNTEVRK